MKLRERLYAHIKKNEKLKKSIKKMLKPVSTVAGWFYGSYLTLRYVDEYDTFPAVQFDEGIIGFKITKGFGASLVIRGRLIVTPFAGGASPSSLTLGARSHCCFENDFIIGDDVRIVLFEAARLLVKGQSKSSGSGITCQSKILVRKSVTIGADTIISWNVFITDSDHHPINGELLTHGTFIGDHVWIASGVQVLKGVSIGSNSIVSAQSVVLKGNYPEKSLLVGMPAIVKGKAPDWSRD